MTSLTQFGCLAEKFWRRWLPKMVAELERTGQLEKALTEAEERAATEIEDLRRDFLQQGIMPDEAEARAWEIVRYRYAYLRSES